MPYLGEEGTEQFTVETRLDGKTIREQSIHDPFVNTTTTFTLDRWRAFKLFIWPSAIKVEVIVRGSRAAQRRIMMLDPEELQRENMDYERRINERVMDPITYGECARSGG